MAQFKCRVCEYVYDEEKGDPSSGIAPGTTFEDIPDDWVCPICRLGKDLFEKL
ncbi:MAG: rubredoxin [Chloroflexota bacterium]|nr:rubredoxin [Chloroflexota bacterium]